MFERPYHQRIARVLESLNAPLLLANRCLFGGGTAIALRHGEYRESVDIDFMCLKTGVRPRIWGVRYYLHDGHVWDGRRPAFVPIDGVG